MADGLQAAEAGSPERAVEALEQALSWWRDDPLADVAVGAAMAGELARLHELHMVAREGWAATQLALGRHEQILPELERVTLSYPLRERLWAYRLLALHRSGRSVDALRAYQVVRSRLAEELGVDPSAELMSLYEAILMRDPHLLGAGRGPTPFDATADARNPYKGLRPFTEAEAADFFGRDELIRDLLRLLSDEGRELLAPVVGPSGSGKSSVVLAGLVPALRRGVIPELQDWTMATMLPGADPFGALAAAFGVTATSSASTGDRWLVELLDRTGVPRPLVLIIDQFEEMFTLVADPARRRSFLDGLATAVHERGDVIRLVVTLRADFFDQPLRQSRFGRPFVAGTVAALPLTPEDLQTAAAEPARRVGVTFEPGLVTELVADLADQPGALPLFQYTLTELFERRRDGPLTIESYRALGGVDGAVSRRSDDLYGRLTTEQRAAARQVPAAGPPRRPHYGQPTTHPGQRDRGGGRRSGRHTDGPRPLRTGPAAHLRPGSADRLRHRRTRPRCAARLVEPAALLGRVVPRRPASTGRSGGGGRRVAGRWPRTRLPARGGPAGPLRAVGCDDVAPSDHGGTALPRSIGRQARPGAGGRGIPPPGGGPATPARRQEAVGVGGRGGPAGGGGERIGCGATARRTAHPVRAGQLGRRLGRGASAPAGLRRDRAPLRRPERAHHRAHGAGSRVRSFCAGAFDLVIASLTTVDDVVETGGAAPECPDTTVVLLNVPGLEDTIEVPPNVVPVAFATNEGSFLAGAAAALHSETGRVGFVGGQPIFLIDEFRSGFEAGVAHVDPDVEVIVTYVTDSGDITDESVGREAFDNPTGGARVAAELYQRGADVVYPVAGESGKGVLDAAIARSDPAAPLRVIGVDTDWHLTEPAERRRHVLTSMVIRLDVVMMDIMRDFVAGELASGPRRYGVVEAGAELSARGGNLIHTDTLESLRQGFVARHRAPTADHGDAPGDVRSMGLQRGPAERRSRNDRQDDLLGLTEVGGRIQAAAGESDEPLPE